MVVRALMAPEARGVPGPETLDALARLLVAGGSATEAASLLHVAILIGGPAWYRFFGAGEGMARMVERGFLYPYAVTALIASVLGVWALYAASGAGLIRRLPGLRGVLALIAAAYLLRGVLGVPAVLLLDGPYANELRERMTFMAVTSLLCMCLGLCYALGAAAPGGRPRATTSRGAP